MENDKWKITNFCDSRHRNLPFSISHLSSVWSETSSGGLRLPQVLRKVITGPVSERHDGVSCRFLRMRYEARGVDDEQVFDVVATAPLVEDGGARVIAHAAASGFVSDAPQRIGSDLLVRK